MFLPSVPVRHGWIIDLYPADGAGGDHDWLGGADGISVVVNLELLHSV